MCDKWGTDLELDELEVEVKVGHSSFNLVLKRHGEVGFVEHDDGVIELGHEVRVDVLQNPYNTNIDITVQPPLIYGQKPHSIPPHT